jgi:hypothetical protein
MLKNFVGTFVEKFEFLIHKLPSVVVDPPATLENSVVASKLKNPKKTKHPSQYNERKRKACVMMKGEEMTIPLKSLNDMHHNGCADGGGTDDRGDRNDTGKDDNDAGGNDLEDTAPPHAVLEGAPPTPSWYDQMVTGHPLPLCSSPLGEDTRPKKRGRQILTTRISPIGDDWAKNFRDICLCQGIPPRDGVGRDWVMCYEAFKKDWNEPSATLYGAIYRGTDSCFPVMVLHRTNYNTVQCYGNSVPLAKRLMQGFKGGLFGVPRWQDVVLAQAAQ